MPSYLTQGLGVAEMNHRSQTNSWLSAEDGVKGRLHARTRDAQMQPE